MKKIELLGPTTVSTSATNHFWALRCGCVMVEASWKLNVFWKVSRMVSTDCHNLVKCDTDTYFYPADKNFFIEY